MKRKFCCLFSIIVLFWTCSCAGSSNETELSDDFFNFQTDMQYYYRSGLTSLSAPITESEQGYYYASTNGSVIYIDKQSQKATPLCDKINCNHNDPDECDSFFYSDRIGRIDDYATRPSLQYYDGKLYFIFIDHDDIKMQDIYFLSCVNPDGHKFEKITNNLKVDEGLVNWFLHRGYIYIVTNLAIYRLSLDDTNKDPETIFKLGEEYNEEKGSNNIDSSFAYGNKLFFRCMKYEGMTYEDGNNIIYWRVMDLMTMEIKKLDFEEKELIPITFSNGEMYYDAPDSNTKKHRIYSCDLDGENNQFIGEIPFGYTVFTDGKYFYTDDYFFKCQGAVSDNQYMDQTIKIYDMKLENEVDSFKIPSTTGTYIDLFQNDQCFIFNLTPKGENAKRKLYYLDKSKIGSFNGDYPDMSELCELTGIRR